MTIQDARGLVLSGADAATAERFETALAEFQCYVGNPVGTIEAALQARPDFVLGHALRGYLYGSSVEGPGLAEARASLAAARGLPATDRERQHVAALEAMATGHFDDAERQWEALLVAYPRDVLALQIAHLFDFLRGDARNLRDRVARRLHAWSKADPGYHAVVGMHAFGLEEMGEYDRAEARGREAVALNARDGWGYHAVAHVLEMRNQPEEGVAWLASSSDRWAPDSFFRVHNWWHLALYHLELDQLDNVLALYDGPIRGERSAVALDLIDASAMLWRLLLRGHDVGDRWRELADAWTGAIEDGVYAFNDVHALMAFVGAGDRARIEQQLATLKRSAQSDTNPDNRAMARGVGVPVGEALIAFGQGRYADAVDRLQHLRPIAHRFGGSHAQRDVLDLTLIEAARRAGDRNLLAALASERAVCRPRSPLAGRYLTQALAA
ncbi:MAG: tetratricopeptide repeat protein [Alphaproteobacteria bacterium]|nr:tetratricopeptide repeat protein [Alphaproteobacteria bacterium]